MTDWPVRIVAWLLWTFLVLSLSWTLAALGTSLTVPCVETTGQAYRGLCRATPTEAPRGTHTR